MIAAAWYKLYGLTPCPFWGKERGREGTARKNTGMREEEEGGGGRRMGREEEA